MSGLFLVSPALPDHMPLTGQGPSSEGDTGQHQWQEGFWCPQLHPAGHRRLEQREGEGKDLTKITTVIWTHLLLSRQDLPMPTCALIPAHGSLMAMGGNSSCLQSSREPFTALPLLMGMYL